MAVRADFHAVAQSLLDAGAELRRGKSTLHQAVADRDKEMVVLLLEAAKASHRRRPALPLVEYVSCAGRDGWTALGLAARIGDVAIVNRKRSSTLERTGRP